jgi:Pentapeptide repeats (8 copies)
LLLTFWQAPDWLLFLVAVLVIAFIVAVIGFLPLSHYIKPTSPEQRKDVAGLLLQIVGGMALIVGVYFTWQELKTSKEGQITERFTRAIDQLGKTDDREAKDPKNKSGADDAVTGQAKSLAVRLGGIYALERIARDSAQDHPAIMEILTAYVRQNAGWRVEMEQSQSTASDLHADIQAILTVIGRRSLTFENGETQRLDLSATNLNWAVLNQANLNGMVMNLVHLENAQLKGAKLRDAKLLDARFSEAFLEGADFYKADLRGAKLYKALMQGTILTGADLRGADLREAIDLTQQQIDTATTDASTQVRPGLRTRGMP